MSRFSTYEMGLSIGKGKYFTLSSAFDYLTHVTGKMRKIYVQPGFKTDLATIPWWAQWYIDRLGDYNQAAVLHDYLLQHRHLFPYLTRKQIDQIYREALEDLGVKKRHCRVMYLAVRANSIWREGL